MDRTDVDGLFVVIDLDNEEVFAFCETEEEAKRCADAPRSLAEKAGGRASFAVCRLELLD